MNEFQTVFVMSTHVAGVFVAGAVVGLVGTILYILLKTSGVRLPRKMGSPVVGIVGCGFIFLASAAIVVVLLIQSHRLASLYKGGQYEVVEGTVHVLHEQAFHGHDEADLVAVGDRQFQIDAFVTTPGYSRTITHGGALREGVYARVYHREGTILRIDIRRGPSKD